MHMLILFIRVLGNKVSVKGLISGDILEHRRMITGFMWVVLLVDLLVPLVVLGKLVLVELLHTLEGFLASLTFPDDF